MKARTVKDVVIGIQLTKDFIKKSLHDNTMFVLRGDGREYNT